MASQLRLHVLLPLAVLGLLGAAFGAYMVGNDPGGGNDSGIPLITTHEQKPAAVTKKDWADKANAWCADFSSRLKPPKSFATRDDFESWFGEAVQTVDSAIPAFDDLGWPKGHKGTILKVRRLLREQEKLLRLAFNRFQAGDLPGVKNAVDQLTATGSDESSLTREFRALGATTCAESTSEAAKTVSKRVAVKPAADLLRAQLDRYRKVVVLFYKPNVSYDAIQTREARAGALAAGAGFVAVDVSRNQEVAQLAADYDVLESPTVLVFVRGPKVKARLEGYYDRTAVLQAVKNA
jgi:hypothetical protein